MIVAAAKWGRSAIGRLCANTGGNVAIMFAFAAVPMLLALGAGVDYGLAMKRQARMNAAADAAALDVVTPTMMAQPASVAKAAAIAFFNTQVANLVGTTYNASNLTVTVTDTPGTSALKRVATVTYTATSTNTFATLLKIPTLTIKGTSTATASTSPNIDFYLMLDDSPSMAIAATTDGIDVMVKNTSPQGGCAFACHETNPAADSLGNPGGPNQDNYALARSLNVKLRIDLVQSAVSNLMTTASKTESNTKAVYRMAGYTFDSSTTQIIPLTSNLTTAQNESSNIALLTVYQNGYLTQTNHNRDADTNFDQAFSTINNAMPNPGGGTNISGDSPQEVLFVVTDAVSDYIGSGNGRAFTPMGPSSTWCSTIKARGIRIAMLYTTYNPLPTSSFYNTFIASEQSSIAPKAQACASPGLFFQVDTDGDISAAMTTLFATAVASAHLTY